MLVINYGDHLYPGDHLWLCCCSKTGGDAGVTCGDVVLLCTSQHQANEKVLVLISVMPWAHYTAVSLQV